MKHIFTKAEAANGARRVSEKRKEEAGRRLVEKLTAQGFELLSKYEGKSRAVAIRCLRCGTTKELTPHQITTKGTTCATCKRIAREEARKAEKEEKAKKSQEFKEEREAEHLRRLTAPRICKRCGKTYTIEQYMKSIGTRYERNSGYCSRSCRDKAKAENDRRNRQRYRSEGKRHQCKHYTRAKELGLPAEEGITLKKLIARDGATCAICGLACDYGGDFRGDLYPSIDHIVPLAKGGGHTWDNVQVAHRLCNSNKRDLVGKEWNNTQKGGATQP